MSEKDISEINIIYDVKGENEIKIFGAEFVENNKNICKMIIDNKEYEIEENYHVDSNNNTKLKIKLKGINNVTNMSCIFLGCSSISSLPDISKLNTNHVTDLSYMFYECSSLSSIPDISKWNTNNVTNMSCIFLGCSSLLSLPDISKWSTNNVTNISYMFNSCSSLSSIPDISIWNTNKVTNMSWIFLVILQNILYSRKKLIRLISVEF